MNNLELNLSLSNTNYYELTNLARYQNLSVEELTKKIIKEYLKDASFSEADINQEIEKSKAIMETFVNTINNYK